MKWFRAQHSATVHHGGFTFLIKSKFFHIFASSNRTDETYKDIFGIVTSDIVLLLLCRYQHVRPCPHVAWSINRPLPSRRRRHTRAQRFRICGNRHTLAFPVGVGCSFPFYRMSVLQVVRILYRIRGTFASERGSCGIGTSRAAGGIGIPDHVGNDDLHQVGKDDMS